MPEERKLVTILFADVTGSTSLGESLDPEDFRALMGRYYEHAREVIGSFGGTLEKFIGDAVMAVFGLPWRMTTTPSGRWRRRWPCTVIGRMRSLVTTSNCAWVSIPAKSWQPLTRHEATFWLPATRSTRPRACSRMPTRAKSSSVSEPRRPRAWPLSFRSRARFR